MVTYKEEKNLPADQLFDLYESIGWTKNVRSREKHSTLVQKVYKNSDIVISAWDENKLIGTVRAISDTFAHGIIYGLTVGPNYPTSEIAKELIKRCIAKYPKIQWSAEVEDWEEKIFKDLDFHRSKNNFLNKGDCPI